MLQLRQRLPLNSKHEARENTEERAEPGST